MSKIYPPSFNNKNTSPGERQLFELFRTSKKMKDWIIHHSFVVKEHNKKKWGEIDFMILIPERGILCIEVKAHKEIELEGRQWKFSGEIKEDPFKQVMDSSECLRKFLIRNEGHQYINNLPWFHGVIFTDTNKPKSSEPIEWHDWQLLDQAGIAKGENFLICFLRDLSEKGEEQQSSIKKRTRLTKDTLSSIDNLLANKMIFTHSSNKEIYKREMKNATLEQLYSVKQASDNERIFINGLAGTGKTAIAQKEAIRLSKSHKKILFLCYSPLLAKHIRLGDLGKINNIEIFSLDELLRKILNSNGIKNSDIKNFSNSKLIEMLNTSKAKNKSYNYDFLIIDEAQDLVVHKSYLEFINNLGEDSLSEKKWQFYGDLSMQILDTIDQHGWLSLKNSLERISSNFAKVRLRTNCRNKKDLAKKIELQCNVKYQDYLLDSGKNYFPNTYSSDQEQFEKIIEVLEELKKNYENNEIVLLSPKNECIALRRIKEFEKKGFHLKSYQGNILNNFIRYSSIDSFKGLESDVVLLTDLDYLVKNKKDKNIYYTGLSRSTDKIYTFQNNNFIKSLTDS